MSGFTEPPAMEAGPVSSSTVFVGNLSWGTTSEDLRTFMSSLGEVVSAEVQSHTDSGRSKGWGLVTYADPAIAEAAIEQLNNVELGGRPIHIRLDRKEVEASGGFPGGNPTNTSSARELCADYPKARLDRLMAVMWVFVGNLPWSTTDDDLQQIFAPYEPYDCHVKTNMAGRSRGFGILRFATPELGQRAIAEMQSYQIDSRAIQVREDREVGGPGGEGGGRGQGTGKRPRKPRKGSSGGGGMGSGGGGMAGSRSGGDACTVFVGNLAWGTTDEDLLATFQSVGTVQSAQVQIAPSGRSKGWGLVTYSDPAEAETSVSELNNSMLHERRLTVRLDRK